MKLIKSKKDYRSLFSNSNKQKKDSRREEALSYASDYLKFEIEMYWKRAAYFWALIGATFAGYITVSNNKNADELLILLNCLGLVFSVSWYLVNRGSKYWQMNWQKHVEMLEDDIHGPLFKTVLRTSNFKLFHIYKEYPFSVTKINQSLSLYVTVLWTFLLLKTILSFFKISEPFRGFYIILFVIITVGYILSIMPLTKIKITESDVNFETKENLRRK